MPISKVIPRFLGCDVGSGFFTILEVIELSPLVTRIWCFSRTSLLLCLSHLSTLVGGPSTPSFPVAEEQAQSTAPAGQTSRSLPCSSHERFTLLILLDRE